jgi:phospholipid transport system substrate-binding protein
MMRKRLKSVYRKWGAGLYTRKLPETTFGFLVPQPNGSVHADHWSSRECRTMQRRIFLAASAAALLLVRRTAMAAVSANDAEKFIDSLGENAISSLTGSTLSAQERATRFRALMVADFDMPSISKFALGRYWKIATPDQQKKFQKLFEDLLVQSYAKVFAQYAGEKFKVTGAHGNDDSSMLVNSSIVQSNGDIIRLDWRVEDQSGTPKIIDLLVEGISLRTTHRSDFASAIQSNGGTIAGLLDVVRQKVGSQ